MSQIAPALHALETGDLAGAKSMASEAFDHAPGEAAALLARIAIEEGDFVRAEALSRTAIENFAPLGFITLADAIGRQGRRSEAEEIALGAISANPNSGMLRAVLGEQRVRQAKWDLGTQDFIDALTLDNHQDVTNHLWRVLADLATGHRAEKVPTDRALTFITRIQSSAPRGDGRLRDALDAARHAIESRSTMPASPPPRRRPTQPGRSAPPPPPASGSHSRAPLDLSAPTAALPRAPDLVSALRRDRQLNESLQQGLQPLGLPTWPSAHAQQIDTIPAMVPRNLEIDPAEFRREHLNVTTGSVASEIIIERALQELMLATASGSALAPLFDNVGLTRLEIALWDGALDRMKPIPPIYLGETKGTDIRVLAIGAFLGACVVKPGTATWSFERDPVKSTIETTQGDLAPFTVASNWVAAADKDDVALEAFLGEARLLANLTSKFNARHDPTAGLDGAALAMKLAELWLGFRRHPSDTNQNEIAAAIRPLNVMSELVFFAISAKYAPPIAGGGVRGEVALAYLRATGEFLVLGSRKHFARAIGVLCKSLTVRHSATILDLFSSFHEPRAKVFHDPNRKPKLTQRGASSVLEFGAEIDGTTRAYALIHEPKKAIPWQFIEA